VQYIRGKLPFSYVPHVEFYIPELEFCGDVRAKANDQKMHRHLQQISVFLITLPYLISIAVNALNE
jgi:hypothetical protein